MQYTTQFGDLVTMQNIWLLGIVMVSLLGSGAVMGYSYMRHNGMMDWMYGDECSNHYQCEFEEGCEEHSEEYCEEEHKDCNYHHSEQYYCCGDNP
jgi:hypothetical protein